MQRSSSGLPRGGGMTNETSGSSYGINSFPHYKQIKMPPDQQAKLQAMHDASRANAGIYVAVVLAVYIILLTMLLCRYSRRQRPSSSADGPSASHQSHHHHHHISRPSTTTDSNSAPSSWFREALYCCGYSATDSSVCHQHQENRLEEIIEYPLTSLGTSTSYPHRKPSIIINNGTLDDASCSNRPVPV